MRAELDALKAEQTAVRAEQEREKFVAEAAGIHRPMRRESTSCQGATRRAVCWRSSKGGRRKGSMFKGGSPMGKATIGSTDIGDGMIMFQGMAYKDMGVAKRAREISAELRKHPKAKHGDIAKKALEMALAEKGRGSPCHSTSHLGSGVGHAGGAVAFGARLLPSPTSTIAKFRVVVGRERFDDRLVTNPANATALNYGRNFVGIDGRSDARRSQSRRYGIPRTSLIGIARATLKANTGMQPRATRLDTIRQMMAPCSRLLRRPRAACADWPLEQNKSSSADLQKRRRGAAYRSAWRVRRCRSRWLMDRSTNSTTETTPGSVSIPLGTCSRQGRSSGGGGAYAQRGGGGVDVTNSGNTRRVQPGLKARMAGSSIKAKQPGRGWALPATLNLATLAPLVGR